MICRHACMAKEGSRVSSKYCSYIVQGGEPNQTSQHRRDGWLGCFFFLLKKEGQGSVGQDCPGNQGSLPLRAPLIRSVVRLVLANWLNAENYYHGTSYILAEVALITISYHRSSFLVDASGDRASQRNCTHVSGPGMYFCPLSLSPSSGRVSRVVR